MRVAGLDLSMTATGVCHGGALASQHGEPCWHTIKTRGTKDNRLVVIKDQALDYVSGSVLVLIEGYLNHSHSAGITGMVHGAVRTALLEVGIPYATLPPSSLKKYATGKGGASKTDMAMSAFKRAGVEFGNDNECDAWWLWVAAHDHLGAPLFSLPKVHRDALAAIHLEV